MRQDLRDEWLIHDDLGENYTFTPKQISSSSEFKTRLMYSGATWLGTQKHLDQIIIRQPASTLVCHQAREYTGSRVVPVSQATTGVLTFQDLQHITGYQRRSDVERSLIAQGVRLFRGRTGPWTTLDLINHAGQR